MKERSDFACIAIFLFKVIFWIGFIVLEIHFFRNYHNAFYRTGEEVNITIVIAGWLAQIVVGVYASDTSRANWLFNEPPWVPIYGRRPSYLSNFIIAITFISGVLFFVSCMFFRNQALFIIAVILMLANIITSAITIWKDL